MGIRIYNDDDDDIEEKLERYMKHRVDGMIANYLQVQLRGIVEAKLANLRLTDPNFPSFDAHIHEQLQVLVDKCVGETLPHLVRQQVSNVLSNLSGTLR